EFISIIISDTGGSTVTVSSAITVQPLPLTPTLIVKPSSGPPGTQLILTGSGYDPNAQVEIDFTESSTSILSGLITDNSGSFTGTTVIPANVIAPFSASISGHETANPSITASVPFSVTVQTIPTSFTAVSSGDWNNPATWGGIVPDQS